MRLPEVRLQQGESLENALRCFTRKVQQENIIKRSGITPYYLNPGEKKRERSFGAKAFPKRD